jgi:predicted nucleotidyltransferase
MVGHDDAIGRLRGVEPEARALGVTHMFLFGSVACGEAHADSDVDAFVDRDPAVPFRVIELGGLGVLLEDVLGAPIEVRTRKGLHRLIRADVEKNAIRVF